jgi:hypothetical protein
VVGVGVVNIFVAIDYLWVEKGTVLVKLLYAGGGVGRIVVGIGWCHRRRRGFNARGCN